MEKMEKKLVNLKKLWERKKNQSRRLPHVRLEEVLVAVENEVARRMILTGGPGSRRFDC